MKANHKKSNKINGLELLFSRAPRKCNCHACIQLHESVKESLGLSQYNKLCSFHGITKI